MDISRESRQRRVLKTDMASTQQRVAVCADNRFTKKKPPLQRLRLVLFLLAVPLLLIVSLMLGLPGSDFRILIHRWEAPLPPFVSAGC